MYTVIYKSKAKENFMLGDIKDMLLKAKANNKLKNISGCLIYHEKIFIQIFEGPDEEVKTLFQSIKNDARHFEIETLVETKVDHRLWSDWAMAFYAMPNKDDGLDYKRLLLENHLNSARISNSTATIFDVFKTEAQKLLV